MRVLHNPSKRLTGVAVRGENGFKTAFAALSTNNYVLPEILVLSGVLLSVTPLK